SQFEQCGYEIANRSAAAAATPFVVIRDPGAINVRGVNARIVMAIVYPDIDTATATHLRSHRQAEERIGERWPFSDDFGPQLLAGYSPSVWRANVALVQTSVNTLSSMYYVDEQEGEARVARPDLHELGFGTRSGAYGVDSDFVSCLEDW